MEEDEKTYSIALRLRRVTVEDAYVAVPVTQAIMKSEAESDGTFGIEWEALVAEAMRLGAREEAEWRVEEITSSTHPTQKPCPDDRQVLDGMYLAPGDTE